MRLNTIASRCVVPLLAIVVLVITGLPSYGADSKAVARQTRFSPFWTNEEDCQTTMHLRNNLVNSDLTVSPVLYMEDGEAIRLSPMTLPPSASAAIPVNETVRNLGYHDPLFGGAEFHFDAAYPGALSVETEMIEPELNFAIRSSHSQRLAVSLTSSTPCSIGRRGQRMFSLPCTTPPTRRSR